MSNRDDAQTGPIKVGSSERKRAAIALGVLAACALVVVVIMVYALGTGGGSPATSQSNLGHPVGPAVTVTGNAHASNSASRGGQSASSQAPQSTATHPSKSVPSTGGPTTCASSSPCALSTDVGDAIGALNKYRAEHGAPVVSGKVSKAAKKCALANGDEGSCPSGYFWEPVGDSGKQVIQKIAAQGGGSAWLLNKSTKKYAVGWAYLPSSKSYSVALVALGG